MSEKKNEIILFENQGVKLEVNLKDETVWLNRQQLSELFDRDIKTIGKHINNALKEELKDDDTVVAKFATTATDGKKYSELKPHEKEFWDKKNFIFYDLKNKNNTKYINTTLKRHIEDLIEDDMKSLSLVKCEYCQNTGYIKNTDLLTCLFFMANILCLGCMVNNIAQYSESALKNIILFEIWVNLYNKYFFKTNI